jgi:hypothetical protein
MIVDTSYFEPFYQAECKKTYEELVDYLIGLNFDETLFKKLGIYYEVYTKNRIFLYVPISVHFLLHYLYAKENKDKQSFVRAYYVLKKDIADPIRCFYSDKYAECTKYLPKHSTYENLYGAQKAKQIKEKLSLSMKNIPRDIIQKRNKSISIYASQRPNAHNKNISIGRKKKIIDLRTQKVYNSIDDAVIDTNVCKTYIRQCCKQKRKLPNNNFYYYKEYQAAISDLL